MNLTQYKALFFVATAILALLVVSPALQRVLVFPQTEFFTEISLLGPSHTAENYPHNITRGENYSVDLGVSNRLGSCAYYQVEVKFRNETQSGPNSFNHTSSSLPSLNNLNLFVADKESLEVPINFAFDYSFRNVSRTVYNNITLPEVSGQNATFELRAENITILQANFDTLNFNGEALSLQGYTSDWNSKINSFFGNLIFEVWIYNGTAGVFQYHERYVDLKLNMTYPTLGV